jgi:hypothetical protein
MRVDYQPKTIDFSVATLDEPGKVRPAFHIFWSSRIDWLDWDDGLPKYDRFRPTREAWKEPSLRPRARLQAIAGSGCVERPQPSERPPPRS